MTLPAGFAALLKDAVEDEAAAVLDSLGEEPPVSVRFNPYKGSPCGGDAVPWEPAGRYLGERPYFTADPAFHGGAYYVQEASSMFAGELMRRAAAHLSGGRLRILDLCAAPGGKATHYSAAAGPGSLIVANEAVRGRIAPLADNVRKWGLGNVTVTNNDPSRFGRLPGFFDIVAVDAPCSGEGMFRKNPEAAGQWSRAAVETCAARQRRILADAWAALRPGGVLVYSTCTFNRAENEDNVAWLRTEFGAEPFPADIPSQWNILATESAGITCYRLLPSRIKGEGFFAAAVLKPEGKRPGQPRIDRNPLTDAPAAARAELARWTADPGAVRFLRAGEDLYIYPSDIADDALRVAGAFNAVYGGVSAGRLYDGRLKPDHPLALYPGLGEGGFARTELTAEDALTYLSRGVLPDTGAFEEGFNLLTCRNLPLGWAKRIGLRVNNLYPKSLMIMKNPDKKA